MEYINIVIKRKWLILFPTLFIMILVGFISFILPKVWEIDMLLQPGKLFVQTGAGEYKEIVITDPKQIAGQINENSYNDLIAKKNNIDIKKFPKLIAENLRDTKLLRVKIRENDTNKAKLALNSLFDLLKTDLDKKIEVETKGIDTAIEAKNTEIKQNGLGIKDIENRIALKRLQIGDKENEIKTRENEIKKRNNDLTLKDLDNKSKDLDIQSKEIEKGKTKKEIESNQNKLKISEERVKSILDEMKSVKKRIDELDEQQRKALAEKRRGVDAISLLLYSSEVQQNLRYYDTLNDKSSTEKITQENLYQDSRNKEEQIRQLDNQISQIKTQKETINTQKESIKAEISNIETQIAVIKNDISKIYNDIETTKNEIEKIKNNNATLTSDIKLLGDRKARIDYTQMIKSPTASLYPVAPNKKMNILIAGVFGGIFFTILAFFLDYLKKQKAGIPK